MGYHQKLIFSCLIITTVFFFILHTIVYNQSSGTRYSAEINVIKSADGFYRYVLTKGIDIKQLSDCKFRISHLHWSCDINTSIALNFRKQNISWKDMFETRTEVLSKKTVFSPDALREKMGILPVDGTPVTLVARQGNVSVPKQNVIIRLNQHGPLDARTTMIMSFVEHIKTIINYAREQPNEEIIHWKSRRKVYKSGLWNTSNPIVVPEKAWSFKKFKYYRGQLFFMKGSYDFGSFSECRARDGIGLGAINRVAHLKGDISTLGFSTRIDGYNTDSFQRFTLLSHKLPWAYFVVKELTDKV